VEAGEQNKDTAVTLTIGKWKAHFPQKGLFRIDSDPPRLWALRGSAEVDSVKVEAGTDLPLAAVLVPEQSDQPPSDALSDWARGRSQSIVADNAITAQIDEDPPELGAGLDNFVYYPTLGLTPSLGSSYSSLYSSVAPYQPGFSSIYLPGYSYQPIFIGLPFSGISIRRPVIGGGYIPGPIRIGGGLGTGIGMPRPSQPSPRPAPIRVGPPPIRVGLGHR
jgi:hypothetical protein